ncbi:MAG: hypothetical protein MAG431_00235 [Chloroflexi bacterium]|nr:hypothetical protein [Chloroflexota bacterium]
MLLSFRQVKTRKTSGSETSEVSKTSEVSEPKIHQQPFRALPSELHLGTVIFFGYNGSYETLVK